MKPRLPWTTCTGCTARKQAKAPWQCDACWVASYRPSPPPAPPVPLVEWDTADFDWALAPDAETAAKISAEIERRFADENARRIRADAAHTIARLIAYQQADYVSAEVKANAAALESTMRDKHGNPKLGWLKKRVAEESIRLEELYRYIDQFAAEDEKPQTGPIRNSLFAALRATIADSRVAG